MIADKEAYQKLSFTVTELFLIGRKLNISLVCISQSYFKVPKIIRLNATHCFIMKIPGRRKPQQIASNHLSDIEFKYSMKLRKSYTKEPFSFLVNDSTLPPDNLLRFRKNVLKKTTFSKKIKTINNKIEQNKAQCDLDEETAKISALSSGNIKKFYQKKTC